MIYIEETCGELMLRLVSTDAVCSCRTYCKCEEHSAYRVAGVEELSCKNYSLCNSRAFYPEQFDSSSYPATKFLNEIFNTILPLKFMSFECYHCSELKRTIISNKFF